MTAEQRKAIESFDIPESLAIYTLLCKSICESKYEGYIEDHPKHGEVIQAFRAKFDEALKNKEAGCLVRKS